MEVSRDISLASAILPHNARNRDWNMQNPMEYYTSDGPMTALGAYAAEFDVLPRDLASLCEVIQGVLIHRDMVPFLYNLTLSEKQRDDGHIRPIAQMLSRISELDPRPLTVSR